MHFFLNTKGKNQVYVMIKMRAGDETMKNYSNKTSPCCPVTLQSPMLDSRV